MDPVTSRRWILRGVVPSAGEVALLAKELHVSPLLAGLLIVRGVDRSEAENFLTGRLADLPDPLLLPDMQKAAGRLALAIQSGELLAVHGDYDVDGISGTALLVEALNAFGARTQFHIPLRLRDGYGLSSSAIEAAAAAGARVIVSVDCGVSAADEAILARDHGIDLIVTDHHQPPPQLPCAYAIVNPQRVDSTFPGGDLSGVGVAFFLLVAVRRVLREAGWFNGREEPDLRNYLDLVALGTIADLVPLRGVNRLLTRWGLGLLAQGCRPGIVALREVAGVKIVNSGAVGFQLAPRLNAAGRLEDAARGVELLLERDQGKAMDIARLLDRFNRDRQQIELRTFEEAVAMVAALPVTHSHSIVLASETWHPGVIGIVASRLTERYGRPTILIALDGEGGKGSGRSIRGLHLYRALQECRDELDAFGGHEMAAGLSLRRDRVADFAERFESVTRKALSADDLLPVLQYDGELLLEEITAERITELEGLAPFGMGNPEPLWLFEGVSVRQLQRVRDNHLRFTVCQGGQSLPGIAFGMAGRGEELRDRVDLLATPQINRYQGRETVQLRVRDFRRALADQRP